MSVVLITGSTGLIGSEAVEFFGSLGFDIVGIDNDMRATFFGNSASTQWKKTELERNLGPKYRHYQVDIRDGAEISKIFKHYQGAIELVIHAAAQPSHDWAARDPKTDFTVNANGTLSLLEATRESSSEAVFVFTSTNKVYGDRPNSLPLFETDSRWEIDPTHSYANGIREDMPIDQCLHSLFGASKVAADILVQEYGRYFGMRTACLRGGCLTGPNHSGAQLHGFLAYLMKCVALNQPYTIFGYNGKQVRDNIHSADFIQAINHFYQSPKVAEVYNIGGGPESNCSILEAINIAQEITGNVLNVSYNPENRIGDHIWYISSLDKFKKHYPNWEISYDVPAILQVIYEENIDRWRAGK